MSTTISGLGGTASSNQPQSIIRALQNAGIIGGTTSGAGGIGVAATVLGDSAGEADASRLSPLAQILSPLGQLQQSSQSAYQQIAAQIAGNLTTAAQSAQSKGNSVEVTQLNQLASIFTDASQSGQLPEVSSLASALGESSGSALATIQQSLLSVYPG